MKRIFITGPTGSGKTRLSGILSEIAELPVTHIDLVRADKPGAKMRSTACVDGHLKMIAASDEWIIEGASRERNNDIVPRIDHLVILDFSRLTRFKRVFMRTYTDVGPARILLLRDKRILTMYWLLKQILLNRGNPSAHHAKLLTGAADHVMCFYLKSDADVEKFIRYARKKCA